MPPSLAALLTVCFIVSLFIWESRKKESISKALWVPVLWMVITGSRFVGQWLDLGASPAGGTTGTEGSLIDALYFSTLLAVGTGVLIRRRILLGELFRNNLWMTAFLLYCFASILWSDFSFIAFKRYIKILGHPVVALIILTDPDPAMALRIVMKRCAYLMMPLSLLFIKYFPELGRGFDPWSGQAFSSGIALNKNELGYGCMIFGIFFYWHLVTTRGRSEQPRRAQEIVLSLGFLGMIAWLLHMAGSATSLATLLLGMATIALLGSRIVNKRLIGIYAILAISFALVLETTFDVYAVVVEMLGRDPNLTDRTKVWADALALVDNPLLGAGFESFWLGTRLDILWGKWWWQPNQAHNGYIETYLNLGYVGVILLGGLIVSTFRKISKQLLTDLDFGRLRMGFLVAILFYNYTEATFKGVHLVWTIFFIIAIEYPRKPNPPAPWHQAVPRPTASGHLAANLGEH